MNDARMRTLAAWFREQGGRLNGVAPPARAERAAFVAQRDLSCGEVVLSAPRRLLLSADTARHSPIGTSTV